MPVNKTININPELLKVSSNNKTRKKQSKKKPDVSNVKPNTLKRNLLKRLKKHSSREHKEAQTPKEKPDFSSDFEKGIEYLSKLKKEKKKNKSLKKPRSFVNTMEGGNNVNISLELPPELQEVTHQLQRPTSPAPELISLVEPVNIQPPPPYSNLKGSSKPTFREWKNKTQKATNPEYEKKNTMAEKINKIKSKMQEEKKSKSRNLSSVDNNESIKEPKKKHNKTVKNTFGKQGNKVSVLIKDNKTRKKVQFEHNNLRSKPISTVKEYLREKCLVKTGSKAPPEILRQIYEDVHLTGDVTNKNKETLIHNYISESA